LPKDALEAAERVLQSSQTWRPEPPLDVPRMRESVREDIARGPDEHVMEQMSEHLARTGMTATQAFPTLNSHRTASGVASEGETLVTFTIWRYQWHELEIEERFSLAEDKRKLLYSQQIQGPKGKKVGFEIDFDCR
jgi:hypothetical protein